MFRRRGRGHGTGEPPPAERRGRNPSPLAHASALHRAVAVGRDESGPEHRVCRGRASSSSAVCLSARRSPCPPVSDPRVPEDLLQCTTWGGEK